MWVNKSKQFTRDAFHMIKNPARASHAHISRVSCHLPRPSPPYHVLPLLSCSSSYDVSLARYFLVLTVRGETTVSIANPYRVPDADLLRLLDSIWLSISHIARSHDWPQTQAQRHRTGSPRFCLFPCEKDEKRLCHAGYRMRLCIRGGESQGGCGSPCRRTGCERGHERCQGS